MKINVLLRIDGSEFLDSRDEAPAGKVAALTGSVVNEKVVRGIAYPRGEVVHQEKARTGPEEEGFAWCSGLVTHGFGRLTSVLLFAELTLPE